MTNSISVCCSCIVDCRPRMTSTGDVHDDLVLISTLLTVPPITRTHTRTHRLPASLFTLFNLRIYGLGQCVIVHIMSRTVVSIHTSSPRTVYIDMLNIHAYMKYT